MSLFDRIVVTLFAWPGVLGALGLMVLVLLMATPPAQAASARVCVDRAAFAWHAANARDRGMPQERYLANIHALGGAHPELGLTQAIEREMALVVGLVWRSTAPPDVLYDQVYGVCLTESPV